MNYSSTTSCPRLRVVSFSATTANLSWSSIPPSLYYAVNCTTSTLPEETREDDSILSHSRCVYYTVDNSTSSLLVTGLASATSYTCCIMQDQHCPANLACAGVTTMELSKGSGGGGGLTGAAAGMVGGVIGMLLVLVVLFVVAGIIFSVTYYRKKKINKSATSKPLSRKQSQRYSIKASKEKSLGRKTSMKPPHQRAAAAATDTLRSTRSHTCEDNSGARESAEREEFTQESTMNQADKEEALYASMSIPVNTLQATEGPLVSLTESIEEPDQYEPMLALKPSGPIYGNVSKAKQPLVPDYVNYPKRS